MALQAKTSAANLSSIPGTHVVASKNPLQQVVL